MDCGPETFQTIGGFTKPAQYYKGQHCWSGVSSSFHSMRRVKLLFLNGIMVHHSSPPSSTTPDKLSGCQVVYQVHVLHSCIYTV